MVQHRRLIAVAALIAGWAPDTGFAVDLKQLVAELLASHAHDGYLSVDAHTQMFEHTADSEELVTEYITTSRIKDRASPMEVDYHPCRMRWHNGAAPYGEENRSVLINNNGCYELTHSTGHSGEFHPVHKVEIWPALRGPVSVNALSTGASFTLFGATLFDKVDAASILSQVSSTGSALIDGSALEISLSKTDAGMVTLKLRSSVLSLTELLTLDPGHAWRLTRRERIRENPKSGEAYQKVTFAVSEWAEIKPGMYYPTKASYTTETKGRLKFSATYSATCQLLEDVTADSIMPVIPPGYTVKDHR